MTLCGVLAHSHSTAAALRNHKAHQLISSFPRDGQSWWIDPQGRAALYRAKVVKSDFGALVVALDSSSLSQSTAQNSLFSALRRRDLSSSVNALARIDADFAL